MAEAGMAAYGAAIGDAISLAVVCFELRGKVHAEGTHYHDYDQDTGDDSHVHVDK